MELLNYYSRKADTLCMKCIQYTPYCVKKQFFTFILQDIIIYMHRALITFDVQEVSEKAAVHVTVPVGKAREKLFNNNIILNEATR